VGKSTPAPPPAPDPNVVSGAQTASNVNTAAAQAALNNVNQVTPYGNLTYSQTGSQDIGGTTIPTYTATTTLTPDEQAALTSKQQLTKGLYGLSNDQLSRINSAVSTPFQLSDYGAAPTADANTLKQAQDSIYNQAASRLDPQWQQSTEQMDAQLRNQGFTPGTQGYDNAMKVFNQAKNDAYTSAQNAAVTGGLNQESQQYGLSSSAYQQAIQNALMQRELPLNEASALMSGSQVASPSFQNTPQTGVSPTNVLGAYGLNQNAQNTAYQGNLATNSANNQAAAGAASAALMAAALAAS
jgi:hypothetical protein